MLRHRARPIHGISPTVVLTDRLTFALPSLVDFLSCVCLDSVAGAIQFEGRTDNPSTDYLCYSALSYAALH